MRNRGGDDARLRFRPEVERPAGTLPGDGLSYPELKPRYARRMPIAVPRSSWGWFLAASLVIVAAVVVYASLRR